MGFYLSCKAVILRKNCSLKPLSMTTGGFRTYCAQSLAGLCLTGYQKKKCCENFIKKLTKCKHPTVFSTILRYSKIKKIVIHTIYQNNLYFVKSSDRIIIQIIRKTKSILMFLIKPNNCFTGRYLKPSQH